MKLFLYFCVFISSAAAAVAGPAYTREQGTGAVRLSALTYSTHSFWDRNGKKHRDYNEFHRYEGEVYIEYGLTNCDTLSIKSAYDAINEKMDGNQYGFTDIELGWKRSAGSWGNNVFAFQTTVIVPSEHGYQPAVRYGQFGVEGKLHQSCRFSLCGMPSMVFSGIGYRWYQGYPSDQVRQDFTFVVQPHDRFSLSASSYLDYGLFNGRSRLDQSLIWMNPNYRLWKVEAGVCGRVFDRTWVSLTYFRHLWGENVGTNGGFIGRVIVAF